MLSGTIQQRVVDDDVSIWLNAHPLGLSYLFGFGGAGNCDRSRQLLRNRPRAFSISPPYSERGISSLKHDKFVVGYPIACLKADVLSDSDFGVFCHPLLVSIFPKRFLFGLRASDKFVIKDLESPL
ncbi:hypothetical protein K3169_22550 [Pseudomonas phytophila]|uniref:Uncharacterized protein n=1 Tax=Pseudomonas phytophila TaxID=2867264 RepID=A0ABY6FB24_9PSED|nr:hypothetical protein [Pseudomonas phytophila]UXZ95096.1 hypothetical protein K3169_22550 [Pseudomonas phytophila]